MTGLTAAGAFDRETEESAEFPQDHREKEEALLKAALELAGTQGFRAFTLAEAAQKADLPLSWVREHFPLKVLLVGALSRMADGMALQHSGEDPQASLKEQLFDLFMRRLDVFEDYREGIRALIHAVPLDPALGAYAGVCTLESLKWMADAARLDRKSLRGRAAMAMLLGVWGNALRVWEKDASTELGETMAALQEGLDRMESWGLLTPAPLARAGETK